MHLPGFDSHMLLVIIVQLAVLSSALPTSHDARSRHASRQQQHGHRGHSSLPESIAPVAQPLSLHSYLHKRRSQHPFVSSSPRAGRSSQTVHLIHRQHLPANLTEVKHVQLERRRRPRWDDDEEEEEDDYDSKKSQDDQDDDDSESKSSKSSKKTSKSDDEDEGDEDDGSYKRKTKVKTKATDAIEEEGEDDVDADADDDDNATKPAAKIKTKASKAASEDDGKTATVTESEADEATTTSSTSTTEAASTAEATESTVAAATPSAKVKAVKSVKAATTDSGDDEVAEEADEAETAKESTSIGSAPKSGAGSADCTAVQQIYYDMGGASWTNKDGWIDGGNCCAAYGVSCGAEGKVTALDLGNNNVKGELSASIFQLAGLTRLNLSRNAISGVLPDKFDFLPHLSTIYLDSNTLSGEIPVTLQNSSSLSSLHISNNTLDGMMYFPNAYNLTQLYASKNSFSYLNIEANSALVKVVLDDNQINCTLPDVQAFTDLTTFSVARNKFTGKPFDVSNLVKLTKLDLQQNSLSGPIPDVTPLTSLQYLALNGNSLSGRFPTASAPPSLTICHVDPILTSSCPSASVMSDPESLASKCALKCRGGGKPKDAVDDDGAANDTDVADATVPVAATAGKAQPKHLQKIATAKIPSAAGQEGSTIMGDDTGQTPASLALASTSGAGDLRSGALAFMTVAVGMFIVL